MHRNRWIALFVLLTLATACAPATPGATRSGTEPSAPQATEAPSRTVVIATKVEPTTLAPRALSTTGVSPTSPVMNIFSAWLMAIDGRGGRRPLLAEKQPELNTGDWIVFPESLLILPGTLVVVVAFAAILGMQMSLRCRRTVMAVMSSVGIVGGICGGLWVCGSGAVGSSQFGTFGLVVGSSRSSSAPCRSVARPPCR